MHRIGRTGRAKEKGNSLLFYTSKENQFKTSIEQLMNYKIPEVEFPESVEEASQLIPEEQPKFIESNYNRNSKSSLKGEAFHEKSEKNKKTNQGGSYRRELAKKYKKPKTRGDKIFNKKYKK
jgi:ATP-dependent RNA helicase RhlE